MKYIYAIVGALMTLFIFVLSVLAFTFISFYLLLQISLEDGALTYLGESVLNKKENR